MEIIIRSKPNGVNKRNPEAKGETHGHARKPKGGSLSFDQTTITSSPQVSLSNNPAKMIRKIPTIYTIRVVDDDPIFGHVSLDSTDELRLSSKDVTNNNNPAKSFPVTIKSSSFESGPSRDTYQHLDTKIEYKPSDDPPFIPNNDLKSGRNIHDQVEYRGGPGGKSKPTTKEKVKPLHIEFSSSSWESWKFISADRQGKCPEETIEKAKETGTKGRDKPTEAVSRIRGIAISSLSGPVHL
ncbi:hypothetical protein ACFE04_027524 [Oxalis oulophora]